MKKTLMVLLAGLLLLCACQPQDNETPSLELRDYQPPETQNLSQNVTIFSYDKSRETLTSSIKNIPQLTDQSRASTTLEYLFSSSPDYDFIKNSNGVYDYHLLISNGIAMVFLYNDCDVEDGFERFAMHMSITNTLSNLENINAVSVYAGGRELGAPGNSYLGSQKYFDGNLANYYDNLMVSKETEPITANLFYMDRNKRYILPEPTTITTNYSSMYTCIGDVITTMAKGPANKPDLTNTIASDIRINRLSLEGRTLRIDFSDDPELQSNLSHGALYYTIHALYPQIEGIIFSVNGGDAKPFSKDDFSDVVGCNIVLYFTKSDHKALTPVNRAISARQYNNPTAIVQNLLDGKLAFDDMNAVNPFPSGLSRDDLISCDVVGSTAIVNFKATFYDNCNSLTGGSETVMVYSLVNALTRLESIDQVQFLIEGRCFPYVAGRINYSAPLLQNPGLISRNN